MIGTPYEDRLPEGVLAGMKQVSNDGCFLIKRRIKTLDPKLNAHQRVQAMVDAEGGERLGGWLLVRRKELLNNGVYIWLFHSVWRRPDAAVVEITDHPLYAQAEAITFWVDNGRRADLKLGTAFNSVMVLADERALKTIQPNTRVELKVATPFWTDDTVTLFADMQSHPGTYRMINPAYPRNSDLLRREYECTVDTDKARIVPARTGTKVSPQVYFDYALS